MPTYVYRCSHCKHQFEKLQKFTDPPIERCPNCRHKAVYKVIQPPPIQFKGSGWYITDSKRSSSASTGSNSKKKDTPSEPDTKESPASTSKPADGDSD